MIKLLSEGNYRLLETDMHTKILSMDRNKSFAWVRAMGIGEILVASSKNHEISHILNEGKYRCYEVKNEPEFTDLTHLELLVGNGVWQGYLLPSGIPTLKNNRKRIIKTYELITKTTH